MDNSTLKINGKNQYPVAEKKESLATAERIGVKPASEQYQLSMPSIYNWSHAYQEKGDSGRQDLRCHNPIGKPVPDWKRQKVLAVKETPTESELWPPSDSQSTPAGRHNHQHPPAGGFVRS